MTKWVLVVPAAVLLAFAPSVQGHGAAAAREIDTRLLLDDDGLLGYGGCGLTTEFGAPCTPEPEGLDVLALEVREAWLGDEPALAFRMVFQSFTLQENRGLQLSLMAKGTTYTFVVESPDGTSYAATDLDRLDGPFDVFDGFPQALDAWVRYASLGIEPGDTLTEIRLDGLHEGSMDDLMPGTFMRNGVAVPHVPHDADPGEALAGQEPASYALKGPAPLLQVASDALLFDTTRQSQFALTITNPLASLTQAVVLRLDTDGWAAVTPANLTLEPGASRQAMLTVMPGTTTVTITATSDLGARTALIIPVVSAQNMTSSTSATSTTTASETPGVSGFLLALVLLAAVGGRRR